jgi:hypothetical protein
MRANRGGTGKLKIVVALCCVLYAIGTQCQTSTGQLTISMSVQSSINLVFQNNPSVGTNGFCPLINSGTNSVSLDLGTASFTPASDSLACVAYSHISANTYQVSSAFDVVVTKANTSSPNYQLAAEISTAPPANVVWLVNNIILTNSAFTQLDASDNYSQAITKTLQVQIGNAVPAQSLLETVTFLATAN